MEAELIEVRRGDQKALVDKESLHALLRSDMVSSGTEHDHVVVMLAHEDYHGAWHTVWLAQRSATKLDYPRWYDTTVGGHVRAGEQRDAAMGREIAEELGRGINGRFCRERRLSPPEGLRLEEGAARVWGWLFSVASGTRFVPSEEIEQLVPVGVDALDEWGQKHGGEMTPDLQLIWPRLVEAMKERATEAHGGGMT